VTVMVELVVPVITGDVVVISAVPV